MMENKQKSIWSTHMKWKEMTFMQKTVFVGKNILNLAAFGFLFPNLMD